MRKKIVAGNWKMNLTHTEVINYLTNLNAKAKTRSQEIELVLFPSFIYLELVINTLKNNILCGAQNCSAHNNGAYTGEISAKMLAGLDKKQKKIAYCLVGHSERRMYHNETNNLLSKKVDRLLENTLTPIYCCGETLIERENNKLFEVIKTQISEGLFHLSKTQISQLVIAYEPVWAIGTGKTASSQQAQEMHAYIRKLIDSKYGSKTANNLTILYGGSCKPSNAHELFSQPDIDGGLIGGASLEVDSFLQIAHSF